MTIDWLTNVPCQCQCTEFYWGDNIGRPLGSKLSSEEYSQDFGAVTEGGTARELETRKLFESLGCKVVHYSFAIGTFDFLIIAEVGDDVTALVPPLLASTTGTVGVTTTKLLSSEELDLVAAKVREASFRAAGNS